MRADLLVHDITCLTTCTPGAPDLGVLECASVAFLEGEVAWVGPAAHAPDGRGRGSGAESGFTSHC